MWHQPQLCCGFGDTENRFVAAQIAVVDLYLKPRLEYYDMAMLPLSSFPLTKIIYTCLSCIIFRRPVDGNSSRGSYNNYWEQDEPKPEKEEDDDDNWDLPEEDVLQF
jgi:hypothetical protein